MTFFTNGTATPIEEMGWSQGILYWKISSERVLWVDHKEYYMEK